MYSMSHNDPHDPHKWCATSPTVKKERRFSFNGKKHKHVTIEEIEMAPEVRGEDRKKQNMTENKKGGEFGTPLCREAEIAKWKVGEKEGSRRRGSWH
jgi:hypothetical protein